MIKIYHNPRCTKSRQGIAFLTDKNIDFEVIEYLKEPFTEESLTEVLALLQIEPIALIRKNESIWKEHYKGKQWSNSDLITAMVKHPKLIERPIVVAKNKAVIARPTEAIEALL